MLTFRYRPLDLALFLAALLGFCGFGAKLAMAQDTGEWEDMSDDGKSADGISTEGIFSRMPSAYKLKVVRPGEYRTTEYFFTAELTGNVTATALASDKSSHAGRYAGVVLYCVSNVAAVCSFPALQKNGTPITDAVVVRGKEHLVYFFNEIVPVDTSDSIQLGGNATITGAGVAQVSRFEFELFTPRSFQLVAGSDH